MTGQCDEAVDGDVTKYEFVDEGTVVFTVIGEDDRIHYETYTFESCEVGDS